MAENTYRVQFEGMQHAGGLFNSYVFQVTPPGGAQPHTLYVHVSTSLQIRLWHEHQTEHEDVMAMAAHAVMLHLTGSVPAGGYRDEERTILLLTTNWYPGHPGPPETADNFESFEVTGPGSPEKPTPDGKKG